MNRKICTACQRLLPGETMQLVEHDWICEECIRSRCQAASDAHSRERAAARADRAGKEADPFLGSRDRFLLQVPGIRGPARLAGGRGMAGLADGDGPSRETGLVP